VVEVALELMAALAVLLGQTQEVRQLLLQVNQEQAQQVVQVAQVVALSQEDLQILEAQAADAVQLELLAQTETIQAAVLAVEQEIILLEIHL
jgi:methionine synthase I (cobalamin-dependent)